MNDDHQNDTPAVAVDGAAAMSSSHPPIQLASARMSDEHRNKSSVVFTSRPPHPFLAASPLSKLLFIWPYSFMDQKKWSGTSSDVSSENTNDAAKPFILESDLPDCLKADSSEENFRRFQDMWEAEKQRAAKVMEQHIMKQKKSKKRNKKAIPRTAYPSLHRALVRDFMSTLWFVQPFMCASSTARLVQALALGYLLQSFEVANDNGDGYLWAGVLVLSGFVVLMEHHHVFFWTWRRGMQYRISSIAAIYDKSLRLNSTSSVIQSSPTKGSTKTDNKSAKASATSGQIVNIATNDVERFLLATLFASYLFWAPVQSMAILGLGWSVIGWSFAAGFGILILFFVPLQLWLSKRFALMRSKIASITDKRVTLVSQAVSGVRVMKMQGWEDNFEGRIASIRKKECEQIEKVNGYRALNEAIFFVSNVATSVIIFLIHVGSGGVLTPRNVFTTMVLVNVAQMEITKHLSLAVMGASECWVSVSRIQRFIETPELATMEDEFIPEAGDERALIVKDVMCHWSSSAVPSPEGSSNAEGGAEDFAGLIVALNGVDIEFQMGQLTCIIGAVGSGKSAFISMLAGELPLSKGALKRRAGSTISYAPQDPWIMDGTVKENILLGLPYEAEFYNEVINACGLNVDLAQLRYGEETIVGDRGVQLSGGQRARIALARAFYRNTDIILLDDPLSAVDSRVGRLLFYSAILDLGPNKGKCVVLVTHQHQFIAESRCVIMSDGKIVCVGTYQECVDASGGTLSFAMQNNSSNDLAKLASAPQDQGEEKRDDDAAAERTKNPPLEDENSLSANKDKDDHKETSQVGEVKLDTFLNYLKAMPGGLYTSFFVLILFIVTQGSVLACIAAVGRWSEAPPENQASSQFIGIVVGLVSAVTFFAIVRAFMSFHLCIQASKRLHDDMTRSVLRAKIEFFDTNPLGRILNRFSGDVGSNDDLLPVTSFDFLVIGFLVLGALISAVSVLPVTLCFVPPLVWYFLRVRRIFVTTSRELKRLEGLARSPIFAMLSESLGGIATIRSNGAVDFFKGKFRHVHDGHSRAFFAFIACSRWLGFRMDALMFIFLTIASFAAVIVHQENWFKIDPGILGLAVSLLIQLSGLFQWCIRQSAEVVNQMVAVERVIGFRDLPSEAALVSDGDDKVDNWPSKGEINVKDLCVRYRQGLPLSLRGITFNIDGGSRIGVVGRTGGGKSTLVQSLLRLLEAESGQIMIDGVDISTLGLHKLRCKVSVIPQSPILYGGCSLRDNLDPFHAHTDEQIKSALLDSHMLNAVTSLSHGLDTTVAEGGLNFSVGQRQLLCLARAILRRNKLLVLDEPTANVDSRTDELLQKAVSKSFADATIIAVAHRLDTVIDYDKILVLGDGRVLEYGSPHELIERNGAFASMVNDTGEEMATTLRMRARNRSR